MSAAHTSTHPFIYAACVLPASCTGAECLAPGLWQSHSCWVERDWTELKVSEPLDFPEAMQDLGTETDTHAGSQTLGTSSHLASSCPELTSFQPGWGGGRWGWAVPRYQHRDPQPADFSL